MCIRDRKQGVTNHRVNGHWICGGASNAGCGILSQFFSDLEINELSRQINPSKQTSLNLLPLNSKGERFPVNNSNLAKRFKLNKNLILISGTTDSNASLIAANLGKEDGLTVLGTTIVVKKIIDKPVKEIGITTHRVSGNWICGGASNAGCGILSQFFTDLEIKELSRQINPSKNTS